MNDGSIILSFSEAMNVTSLTATGFTLRSVVSAAESNYTLTGGVVESTSSNTIVRLNLTATDLNAIKTLEGLATDGNNAFLTMLAGAATDMTGNAAVATTSPLQAIVFSEDEQAASFTGFNLNMSSGVLELTFSETMDATIFNIRLSQADVDVVKSAEVCTSVDNCFNSLDSTLMNDMAGTDLTPVASEQAGQLTADVTEIEFVGFVGLDYTAGTLQLSFNEPVRSGSVNFAALQLRDAIADDRVENTVRLTNGTAVLSSSSTVVTIILSDADLNALKLTEELCRSSKGSDCAVYLDSTFVTDAFNNTLDFTNADTLAEETGMVLDTAGAVLVSATFNINTGQLNLTFDEPIQGTSLAATRLTIQNTNDSSAISVDLLMLPTYLMVSMWPSTLRQRIF